MPNWVSDDNADMKHISVSNWKAAEAPVPLVESGDRGKRTWEELDRAYQSFLLSLLSPAMMSPEPIARYI
jgi:hypothetical protein